MASLRAIADSIRAAVESTSTCTPATAIALNDLLLPTVQITDSGSLKPTVKPVAGAKAQTGRGAPAKARGKKVVFVDEQDHKDGEYLSAKERSIMATEVINLALKALTQAVKAPAPKKKDPSKDLVKASARKVLRRSNSMPQSPLQPRSLNRVSSSPDFSSRQHSRSTSSASTTSTGQRSTAECARVAFACLRTLQAAKTPGVDLPPLQLENGMSVLIARLLSLGLDDLAIKELRILKRRLGPGDSKVKKAAVKVTTAPQRLDDLLDFGKGGFTGSTLGLVITTQLQVLKLLASSRKHRLIESAVSFLQPSNPSSPTQLLLSAAKGASKPDKFIRQLLSLSEILLSLSPSVSTSEDAIALESRLSVAPEVALRLQVLALHNRSLWWQLTDHKGDAAKDLLDPFLRCLSAFARRTRNNPGVAYNTSLESFHELESIVSDLGGTEPWPKSNLKGIYAILSSLAHEASSLEDAISWTNKVKFLLDCTSDSDAKRCCVEARLAGLTLRRPFRQPEDEEILLALLEGLERPFNGGSSEIEDLMTEVSSARRAAITILACKSASRGAGEDLAGGTREMCVSLVLLCPRLCLRYLGNLPSNMSATKDILRHEQRRQFISKPGHNSIDSVLFLVRALLAERKLTWDLMDSKLQDCLLLLDRLENIPGAGVLDLTVPAASYYVKLSNLYYSHYLNISRDSTGPKDGQLIRILRRSIDCVRTRPQQEKKAASLLTKMERLAEVYKGAGRYDDLFETLRTLQDEMVASGVLLAVTAAASSMPLQAAWMGSEETLLLSRTMRSLLKVHFKYHGSAQHGSLLNGDWTSDERATMLEQYLDMISPQYDNPTAVATFQTKAFEALLSIYNRREYPLRRLRVLIRLLSLAVDSRVEIVDDIRAEVDALRLVDRNIENSKDVGLQDYGLYLSTLATSTLELQSEKPGIDVLKRSLVIWSSVRRGVQNLETLQSQVEDISGLIAHLQSVADYMQLMGCESSRLATLKLIVDYNELRSDCPEDLVRNFSVLGSQWLHLGYSGKAGLALDKAQTYSRQTGVSIPALLQLHLTYSHYMFDIGNCDKSQEYLLRAKTIFTSKEETGSRWPINSEQKTNERRLLAQACFVQSMLALERGSPQSALTHAKESLRWLRRAWVNLQEHQRRSNTQPDDSTTAKESDKLAEETSNLSMSVIKVAPLSEDQQWESGTVFWPLITPLFRALFYLSNLHAHHGMFSETLYYAEQAHKLVQEVGALGLQAIAAANLGSIWLKAGNLDKGSDFLMTAKQHLLCGEKSRESASLAYNLGEMHGILGDHDAELEAYQNAEATLRLLMESSFIRNVDCCLGSEDDVEQRMASLTISKTKVALSRKAVARSKKISQRKTASRPQSPIEISSPVAQECPQLQSLKATVLRQKARAISSTKKSADARLILNETEGHTSSQTSILEQGLAVARYLLMQSIEQMHADPVYSVLQESTISFPSIISLLKLDRNSEDRPSFTKTSPPRRNLTTKCRRAVSVSKSAAPDNFFDKLRQAQEHLMEVYPVALSVASVSKLHTISALLNSIAILLSASGQIKGKPLANPGFASCSIETARSIALRRERKAILANSADPEETSVWPTSFAHEPIRCSLAPATDMSKFQKDYIDIIPETWIAISIALSDSRNELSITKLEASHSPFVLRLPLGRNNSIDADEEVFDFEQGLSEILEIKQLADESAHGTTELKGREAKSAWWEERSALDARLRDLLGNIEKVWLGGFTGIFSQHPRRPDLLARFQKSFQNILDKYLPSRQKTKRSSAPRIALDSRILDLFIGLGDASDEGCDFSDPLNDLLYFVVDVLQFHGELNAYAEIDFDSIVVETHDALRGYHAAFKASNSGAEGQHTILILDKALHAFPWESLPCMRGLAVSRLPSLGCLRDRILEQQQGIPEDSPAGSYIDRNNGSYILNPEGDLENTQATFEKPLQTLKNWSKTVGRKPSEEEMKSDLASKDLMLYFGHGSGAQFIRARQIRKLEKCAVTMLMGCSSGALKETGEFEPFGPPIDYMHAGSPALVATLWDVTDKDIDRFFQSMFDHWGLFDKQKNKVSKKGKEKATEKVSEATEGTKTSLVEAVARSRDACILPFLNAAAVVVYGVPVYLK